MSTSIEWTEETWNPVRGCARVSAGCERCYAENMAHRFSAKGQPYEGLTVLGKHGPRWAGTARFVPEMLAVPMKWRKPKRVFVNSMSDLFHDDVTNEQIAAIFGVMAACPQHTFQVLTKRPGRMLAWFRWLDEQAKELPSLVGEACPSDRSAHSAAVTMMASELVLGHAWRTAFASPWPLPNVWLGVSCEDQEYANERVPLLLSVPAAVRFVSAEPLLGEIVLDVDWLQPRCKACGRHSQRGKCCEYEPDCTGGAERSRQVQPALLDWVIVGGESGRGARACDLSWVRSVVEQCKDAGVRCFVKQLGAKPHEGEQEGFNCHGEPFPWAWLKLNDRKGGDMGEWPAELRVREYPKTAQEAAE